MRSKVKSKAGFHIRRCCVASCGLWWSFDGPAERFELITLFCPQCVGRFPALGVTR